MQPGYIDDDSLHEAFVASLDSRTLDLTLFVTEQCNFRCTYCYETFQRPAMNSQITSGVIKLIESRAKTLEQLSINWFGGEPLLEWRRALETAKIIKTLSEAHNFRYVGSMTTNGYILTQELFRDFVESGIRIFQISIDGPAEHHDRTRVRRGGHPTYSRIMSNLKSLKLLDGDFQIAIRVHLTSDNHKSIPSFVEYLDHIFGDDERFGLHLVPIERYSTGDSVNFEATIDEASFAKAFAAAIMAAKRIKILNKPKNKCYVCYASKANSLVIRSDGKVLKCTVAVDDEKNHVGELTIDGKLVIYQDKFNWWLRGFSSKNLTTLACPMLGR